MITTSDYYVNIEAAMLINIEEQSIQSKQSTIIKVCC